MENRGIHLIWIVVANLESAVKFYTEVVGFHLKKLTKEFGWAELSGPDGSVLGLSQENLEFNLKAGTNGVITIVVDDLLKACEEFTKKGAQLVGDIMEVPGQVKLQSFVDIDGNMMQLVQKMD